MEFVITPKIPIMNGGNPDMSLGVQPDRRIADKDGILRDAVLYFPITDIAATTERVVIDVYQNGVSIFPAGNDNKLVFASATPWIAQDPVTVFWFLANPLTVTKGDIFTVDILERNIWRSNGILELVVMG
jgi:hypothetical protein